MILWRRDRLPSPVLLGFPCGLTGKESTCNAGDLGLILGLGKSPREGKDYPLQYSGLENSMDCIVHGVTKSLTWLSDWTEWRMKMQGIWFKFIQNLNMVTAEHEAGVKPSRGISWWVRLHRSHDQEPAHVTSTPPPHLRELETLILKSALLPNKILDIWMKLKNKFKKSS